MDKADFNTNVTNALNVKIEVQAFSSDYDCFSAVFNNLRILTTDYNN